MLEWRKSAGGLACRHCTCLNYSVPDLETFLNSNEGSAEVNNGNKKQKEGKKQRRIKKSKETSCKQRSSSHSPARQNIVLQKLCSHKSTQGKDADACGGKVERS
jgi:hypothetical protein